MACFDVDASVCRGSAANTFNDEVRGLVLGHVHALERALAADSSPSIDDLIASEAIVSTAALRRGKGPGPVEHDRGEAGEPSVKRDERFVLEYQTGKAGFALALRHTRQDWGVIKFADANVSKRHPAGPLLVPGIRRQEFVFLLRAGQRRVASFHAVHCARTVSACRDTASHRQQKP